MTKILIICQGITCRKYGSLKLLNLFPTKQTQELVIQEQFCFGKCGNGCVIFLLPEGKFYTYMDEKKLLHLLNQDHQ